MVSEENSAAYLEYTIAEASSLDGAVDVTEGGAGAEGSGRCGKVGEVEDVGCFTTKLELQAFVDAEFAEEGCVDASPSGSIE